MRIAIAVALVALVIGAPSSRAYAATGEVHIVNGAPNPAQLTIQEGDVVVFFNDDDVPHAIFAGGQQRGPTIPPHSASNTYGPFDTGGNGGRADYQVDENGPAGIILIAAPTTTRPTTTTAAPTTSAVPATTTTAPTTTTTTRPTTTSTTTTTTVRSSSSSSGGRGQDTPSKVWLAVFGGLLALMGIGNMVRVMLRPKYRRRRRRQA